MFFFKEIVLWGVFSYQLANDDIHVSENALCKTGDTMEQGMILEGMLQLMITLI